jgi:hypothetical protein
MFRADILQKVQIPGQKFHGDHFDRSKKFMDEEINF